MSAASSSPVILSARRHTAPDEASALEAFHLREWTDGLPIVIPTADRVATMLAGTDIDPDVVLGVIGPGHGQATVEKVAINAIMAGCRPEHFPVVVAAVRAVVEPRFDISEMQQTTHALGPAIIVNGPAREVCGPIASGWGALGPGHRANASIGRSLRLVLMNIGGARPGRSDMAVLGQPGKFTCCFAEAEEESPLPPLHTSFGYHAEQSTVTLVGVESPHSVLAVTDRDDPEAAERLLRVVAASIANAGANNTSFGHGAVIVLLNPLHATVLTDAGLTRATISERLADLAVTPGSVLRRYPIMRTIKDDDDRDYRALRGPEDIVLAVAGGPGIYSAVFNSWGGGETGGVPVTAEIDFAFSCELPGLE